MHRSHETGMYLSTGNMILKCTYVCLPNCQLLSSVSVTEKFSDRYFLDLNPNDSGSPLQLYDYQDLQQNLTRLLFQLFLFWPVLLLLHPIFLPSCVFIVVQLSGHSDEFSVLLKFSVLQCYGLLSVTLPLSMCCIYRLLKPFFKKRSERVPEAISQPTIIKEIRNQCNQILLVICVSRKIMPYIFLPHLVSF